MFASNNCTAVKSSQFTTIRLSNPVVTVKVSYNGDEQPMGASTDDFAAIQIVSANDRLWRKADIRLTKGERLVLAQSGH